MTSRKEKCVGNAQTSYPRRSGGLPGGEARKAFQRRGYLSRVSSSEQELIGPTKGQSGQRRGSCACESLGVWIWEGHSSVGCLPGSPQLPTSFLSELQSEPVWSSGAAERRLPAGVLSLPAASLGSRPARRCCRGQVFRGLAKCPSSHHKEGDRGACPVAVRLGPAVSLITVEDTFLEQTNLTAEGPGGVGDSG